MKYSFNKKNLKVTLSLIVLIASALFILQSCYPGEELTYSNTDIVATFYDKTATFSELKTYFLSDTVYTFDSEGKTLVPAEDISVANKTAILNSINTNLQ